MIAKKKAPSSQTKPWISRRGDESVIEECSTSTEISDGNHMSADTLMTCLDTLMGGYVDIKDNLVELQKAHAHQHKHGLAHAH